MRKFLFLLTLLCIEKSLHAQYVYTIKADSVKITNTCDTAELIIENHTQNVPGFLFNKGRGRTEFRRGLLKITDSIYIVGGDTLKINPWLQGGNRFGSTGIFGTMDNNHVDFYSNSLHRARLTNSGTIQIGNMLPDNGDKVQVSNKGAVTISANLSRSSDRIQIGHYLNSEDGQNAIIRTSNDNGSTYRNVLVERDGYIGLGTSNKAGGWNVGNPAFRLYENGVVNIASNYFMFGYPYGNNNSSSLIMSVSNLNEWNSGIGNYPSRENYYYFGTHLGAAEGSNVRANLKISGRELNFLTGAVETETMRIAESKNVLIGTTSDNGNKLQVIGNVYANGNKHLLGNLAIVSGVEPPTAGSAAGIRIDDASNGSFILQGTNQGWARDMFVFTDTYDGLGQDVYFQDHSIIKIKSGIKSNNTAGNSTSMINIQPNYNLNVNSNPLTMRGIYYKPTLTSIVSGSKHIAIETVTGDVLLGTTSGNTGIGTNSPTAQLHTTSSVRFGGLTSNNSLTRIVVSDAIGNLYYKDVDSSSAFNGILNSDVAINGRISAQKMVISQTGRWPDYVFSKQYQLPSLTEVENFIKQNNHLPGIPSAAEVEKKGIDVGNNQAALLKKIEELTLYTIQQDKELKTLKQEMEMLKALIKEKK